jgi:hypothetical protein
MVLGVRCAHGYVANPDLFSDLDLDDPFEAPPAEQLACAPRHDYRYRPAETLEGGEVEVIAVEVGDEHRVNPAKRLGIIERADPSQVRHAVPECRIGEEPPAVELDEDCAVAYPGNAVAHESRCRSSKPQRAGPAPAFGGLTVDGAFGKQAIKSRTSASLASISSRTPSALRASRLYLPLPTPTASACDIIITARSRPHS